MLPSFLHPGLFVRRRGPCPQCFVIWGGLVSPFTSILRGNLVPIGFYAVLVLQSHATSRSSLCVVFLELVSWSDCIPLIHSIVVGVSSTLYMFSFATQPPISETSQRLLVFAYTQKKQGLPLGGCGDVDGALVRILTCLQSSRLTSKLSFQPPRKKKHQNH